MKRSKWALVPLAALLAVGVYVGNVLATPAGGQSTTTYAKSLGVGPLNLSGHSTHPAWRARLHTHGFSDLYVIDNKFTPGGTSGWHSHPGPSLIFVVAGQITNYVGDDPSCTPHVYGAGQSFTDEGGTHVHMLRNEGSVDAETIAVQILPKDATRRSDAAEPLSCHLPSS